MRLPPLSGALARILFALRLLNVGLADLVEVRRAVEVGFVLLELAGCLLCCCVIGGGHDEALLNGK